MKYDKGFTLLEVIVAVTILGTGLVTVIGTFSGGLRSAILSNDYSKALFLARKKAGELEIQGSFSSSSGIFETEEFSMYKWRVDAEDYPVVIYAKSKIAPRVINVKITVSWNDGKGKKKIELVTLKTVL